MFALTSIATQANENNKNGFYISPKLIVAHASLRAGQVKGSYQEPLILYTDQNHEQNDNNTSDIVGGALLSLGYRYKEWRAELSYSYRYRFDLNGNVGEREPGKYERHDNLPGRFRLDINTQAARFDLYYSILPWHTESLRPFIGVSVESLQHNIHAKVRNRYNYTEEQSDSSSISLGVGIGTEVVINDNINFTVALHYIDLGDIDIGPQSDNAYFSTDNFDTLDLMFGVNYYF
ncbi:MAG: outer membrane protein [Cognaticolwellia sp.]